jgi:iron complex transport system ATP-binding protein
MGVTLAMTGASFAYRENRPIFEKVGFAIEAGQVLCILGPNGVGKSTLLRCLAGLAPLTSGAITIDGHRLDKLSRRDIGRLIGFVPQSDEPVFAFTVRTMVEMGRAPYLGWVGQPTDRDLRIAEGAMNRLGIMPLAERLYPELSGGERQLVLIARALAQEPRLLILDEPTSHLDFANQASVLELLRGLATDSMAIIMTTHDPDHAFLIADQTLVMARDRPARAGATRALLTEALLGETYRRHVRIVEIDGRTLCF